MEKICECYVYTANYPGSCSLGHRSYANLPANWPGQWSSTVILQLVIKRHIESPMCMCVTNRNKKKKPDQVHDLVTLPLTVAGISTVHHWDYNKQSADVANKSQDAPINYPGHCSEKNHWKRTSLKIHTHKKTIQTIQIICKYTQTASFNRA